MNFFHNLNQLSQISISLRVVVSIFAIIGTVAWGVIEKGMISPSLHLSSENQLLRSEIKTADKDNNELRAKIIGQKTELKISSLKIDQLGDQLELKKLNTQLKIEQNRMITQLINSCISSTSTGEDSKSAGEGSSLWGSKGGDQSVAIVSVKNPQDGSKIFSDCLKIYNTELKNSLLHLVNQ